VKDHETILNSLLEVCLYSGTRNMGIAKVMDENRNLLLALLCKKDESNCLRPPPCECFPWTETIIQAHDLFFESLLSALRPTFPDAGRHPWNTGRNFPQRWRGRYYGDEIMWSEEWLQLTGYRYPEQVHAHYVSALADPNNIADCHKRVMKVAHPWLASRLADNRRLMEFVAVYPEAIKPWVGSWLEEIDFFLLDVWETLEMDEFYRRNPQEYWRTTFQPWPGNENEHHEAWLQSKARRAAEVQRNTLQDKQEETPSPREPEAR
jgi:hypothetical protein